VYSDVVRTHIHRDKMVKRLIEKLTVRSLLSAASTIIGHHSFQVIPSQLDRTQYGYSLHETYYNEVSFINTVPFFYSETRFNRVKEMA
jgi:hypothetical protein